MQYLRVKNLEQYQHYSTRNPPWIKLYRTMLSDYEMRQLTIPARYCYIGCLILASETDNRIPHDPKYLSDRFGMKVSEAILSALIDSGFLLASGARRVLASGETASSLLSSVLITPPNPDLRSNPETEQKPLNGHTGKGKRPIAETDKPTEKHFEFGRSLGVDVGPEWGKFKNYCLAHNKHYANFEAAFRNWLANAPNMKGGVRVL